MSECWHLQTTTNGGKVEIIKAFLTKEQAIFRANRICGNPATDEERERYRKAYEAHVATHGGNFSCTYDGDSFDRMLCKVEVWHPDEFRDSSLERVVIRPDPFRIGY